MTLPFEYSFSLGYYVVPIVVFIFCVLASLELIAEELKILLEVMRTICQHKIADNIKKHVEELL